MNEISTEWLIENKACKGQIENFKRTFPEGRAEINLENAIKAVDAGLNLNWLARILKITDFEYAAFDLKAAHKLLTALNRLVE